MIPEPVLAEDTIPTPPPVVSPALEMQALPRTGGDRGIDLWLLAAVLGLVAIGTVEIYSASAVYAVTKTGSQSYFLLRQLVYVSLGLAALWWAARTDYGWLRRNAYLLLAGSLVLLVGVLVVGTRVGGARRWFHAGPLSFQPVEIAKVALVSWLAVSLARKQEKVRTFTVGFLPHLAVCAVMMGLLLKQPDLGSSLILGATTLLLLFVAGTKLSYIMIAVLAAAPVVYQAIVGTPWRMRRLIAFLDPWQFREGVGYQITESLISIGSGGWLGLGLGDGKQKLFYMPEAHTDFILSNIGEELGFAGMATVIFLFVVIAWRGVRAAVGARDAFGTYLAFGLTAIFALQGLVNAGVVLGALPAKGLTLPFVSYGGTSLIMSMFCAGVLLNIGRRAPMPSSAVPERLRNEKSGNARRRRRRVRVVTAARAAAPAR